MKVSIVILLSLALVAGLVTLLLNNDNNSVSIDATPPAPTINIREADESIVPTNLTSSAPSEKAVAIPSLAKKQMDAMLNKSDHSLESAKRAELEILVDEKKIEIDTLITSLNDNLQNAVERAKIQSKLDVTIEQYNELLLPLALEKMSASVND
jgi:hypothetical protein